MALALTAPTLPQFGATPTPTKTFGPQLPTYQTSTSLVQPGATPIGTAVNRNTSGQAVAGTGTGLIGSLGQIAYGTTGGYTQAERDKRAQTAEILQSMQAANVAGTVNRDNLMQLIQQMQDARIPDLLNRNAALGQNVLNTYATGANQVAGDWDTRATGANQALADAGQTAIDKMITAYNSSGPTGLNRMAGDRETNINNLMALIQQAQGNRASAVQGLQSGIESGYDTRAQNLGTSQAGINTGYGTREADLTGAYTGPAGVNAGYGNLQSQIGNLYSGTGGILGQLDSRTTDLTGRYDQTLTGYGNRAATLGTDYSPINTGYESRTATLGADYDPITAGFNTLASNLNTSYGGVESGYQNRVGELTGLLDLSGREAGERIGQQFDRAAAGASSSLASRGLTNTTVTDSVQRGINEDRSRELRGLEEQLRAQELGLRQTLGGEALAAQERGIAARQQAGAQTLGAMEREAGLRQAALGDQLSAREREAAMRQSALGDQLSAGERAIGMRQQTTGDRIAAGERAAGIQQDLGLQGLSARERGIGLQQQVSGDTLAARERGQAVTDAANLDLLQQRAQGRDITSGLRADQISQQNRNADVASQLSQDKIDMRRQGTLDELAQRERTRQEQAQQRQAYDQAWLGFAGQTPERMAQLAEQQRATDTALARDLTGQRLDFMNQSLLNRDYPSLNELYNLAIQSGSDVPYPVAPSNLNSLLSSL